MSRRATVQMRASADHYRMCPGPMALKESFDCLVFSVEAVRSVSRASKPKKFKTTRLQNLKNRTSTNVYRHEMNFDTTKTVWRFGKTAENTSKNAYFHA
jgi:hypothetical protein